MWRQLRRLVGAEPGALGRSWGGLRRLVPRLETSVVAGALLVTVLAKLAAVGGKACGSLIVAVGDVVLADVAVALAFYVGITLCHLWSGRAFVRRITVVAVLLLAVWSLADAAWLFVVGTQLHVEVLAQFAHDVDYVWPIIRTRAQQSVGLAVLVGSLAGVVTFATAWILIRPRALPADRRGYFKHVGCALLLLVAAVGGQRACQGRSDLGYSGMLLRRSSHVGVGRWLVGQAWRKPGAVVNTNQRIARAGQRAIALPADHEEGLPNVIIVLLESVGYWATTLADADQPTTPVLRELALQGVEFTTTRVVVSRTNKSMFAVLTGVSGGVEADKAEGVLVEPPYESLATVLVRRGYRAGFFQMAKAESCHAPMFANLGFEQFWSRENLEDPSKHLTYAAGDDFAMLDPAFAWARQQPGPYLLVFMTSVAHDPYTVPEWFGSARDTEVDRYLQCVEFTDAFVGAVRERIEPPGKGRGTLLCALADHGEGFDFQHGLWGHLEIPFDEVIRVPWVIRYEAKVAGGTRVEAPCSILDVTPTILGLLGFDISQAGFEGRNALVPPETEVRHYFSCWGDHTARGYVEGTTKYVYMPQAQAVVRYELETDPLEESAEMLEGAEAERVIDALAKWQGDRKIYFPADRFMRRVLFEHWPAWSSGRNSWSYYRP